MNFADRGIIIYKTPLKERSHVVTLFTQNHGLYAGVARSTTSKSKKGSNPGIVEGNLVDFHWQARLHAHLGSAKCELVKSYNSHLMLSKTKLYAFNSLVSLIRCAFCEREPHNSFFPVLLQYMEKANKPFDFRNYIQLELAILQEAGYGLDLSSCTDTGTSENLAYVSPRSGRAVCEASGKPFANKLLPLPQFLLSMNKNQLDNNENSNPPPPLGAKDIRDALRLTSYFLGRYVYPNRESPQPRRQFIELISG